AHIKRRDLWANLAQTILQIAYFYNPLLWIANAAIRCAREQAVDEMVLVGLGGEAADYPQTLVDVARLSLARPALTLRLIGVAESPKALAARIRHMIEHPAPRSARLGIAGAFVLLIAAAVLLPMAKANRDAASPPPPVLASPGTVVEGTRILVPFEIPASEWEMVCEENAWPCHVRINGKDYSSRVGYGPFAPSKRAAILDLFGGIDRRAAPSFPPGTYRVALVFKDIGATKGAATIHFDAFSSDEVEFVVVAKDSPEAARIRTGPEYEGKTIGEWIAELGAADLDVTSGAVAVLAKIGRPAVPALMGLLEDEDPRGYGAANALGDMGEAAAGALPRLLEIARGEDSRPRRVPGETRSPRWCVVNALGKMAWAADRIVPVLEGIARDPEGEEILRRTAVFSLGDLGKPAVPAVRGLTHAEEEDLRGWAIAALQRALEKGGETTRKEFYTALIEADPFAPEVPGYLTKTKDGAISNGYRGKSHPLSERIKGLCRERLARDPDPQVAWNLARIIETQLANTEIEWSVNGWGASGHWMREDPAESYATLEPVLELGFPRAAPGTDLWRNMGAGLAKLRLLRGDWDGMNAALVKLGQHPIPEEERPWLHAPPKDWSDLRAAWRAADPSMRSGECGLALRFEKDGAGLAGVHVLIKVAPEPSHVSRSGEVADTLFLMPNPLDGGDRESFGYMVDADRAKTRYAVSDATGVVRFDGLPPVKIRMEVLIPTGNFAEARRDWDLLIETEPGRFQRAAIYGGGDVITPRHPIAQIDLKPGETVVYPKLRIQGQMERGTGFDEWLRIDPSGHILSWEGLGPAASAGDVTYELELILSAPPQHPAETRAAPVLRSGKEKTEDPSWMLRARGIGALRLAPGNIYLLEVKALDAKGHVLARLPRTYAWVPWPGRETEPPAREEDMLKNSPIHHGVYMRGTYSGHLPNGKEESLDERLDRFLRDYPDAFERNYARVGRAWLDWHGGKTTDARRQLRQISGELPDGNVARETAAWLLAKMERGDDPPKRLDFVASSEGPAND
ncbi:MAG: hypothetical protein JXP34_12815, partial [Planctomycetes bacterium]|nr:hypothetical protein [Planctomycetota bacterium]